MAAVPPFRPGWRLVWADEFEGPDGSRPNPEWWTFDLGGGGWGNNELQTYTDRTRNCRIERGLLVVEAHRETYTGADGITRNYTSARLKTQGRVAFRYGRIEARIRVPRGQGLWPAFWMLGTNFPSVGWPQCGEIDIMENIGREPGTVYGTLHGPGYAGGNAVGGRYTLPHGAALADDFHVFAVEWETNRMRWFIDDILYFTATPASLPVGRTWVFEQPFFLILNVAVGGNWPGSPDATTVFPQRMLVDHVRVYEREDPTRAGCGGNVLWNGGFELGSWGGWLRMGTNVALQGPGGGSARHGGYALRVGASGGGVNTRSGVYQVWPVRPGERFRAAGWTLTPAAQPLTGDSRVWLELSFWDAEGRLRALYRSVALNATALRGHWMRLEVTNRFDPLTHAWIEGATELLAPAGAVGARYEVVLESTSGGGAALWDDLECVAQPSPPIAVEVDRRPEGLLVQFPTCPGARYVVLATPVLAPAEWSVERWWWGDGQVAGLLLPWSSSSRFYTVQRW
ncbi:MAG: glycoside hydrolase family 16 protein [Verrucomicrobiota bacterium]|nr:family 16 glycosylhydrolase [Limisphaera sp.]MDW8382682.1 glycoside hydrolase family 16 protein [Verrucomicrobiota bacterium]